MNGHAKFPPSGAERWLVCGYSIKMAPFYINTDTIASAAGTKQHEIAAMHLINGTEPGSDKLRIYTNAVRMSANDGEMFVERKVIIVPDLCTGTLDAGVIAHDKSWARIFDYKNGTGVVHATNNPQEKLYMLGLLREYPLPPTTPITLTIVQPNGKSGWPVKDWDTDVKTILKFKDKVDAAIDNGLSLNPKAVAGSHCYWCPAKIHCKAYLVAHGKK